VWGSDGYPEYKYTAYQNNNRTESIKRLTGQNLNLQYNGLQVYEGGLTFGLLKKTIKLNTEYLNRYSSYDIVAQFMNCQSLASINTFADAMGAQSGSQIFPGGMNGISISKKDDEFTIFISFPIPYIKPFENRENNKLASFAVLHKEFLSKSHRGVADFQLGNEIALCIYPTVQFQIIGIPKSFGGDLRGPLNSTGATLNSLNPTITLI
jgi:hypothetical protein